MFKVIFSFHKRSVMNFLAHAHLSFNYPKILVGNMISDFVKGKKQFDYPLMVHNGIKLHRAIDNFTDTHEATKQIKDFFRPQYRLYSGAFADVAYDHFLANDTTIFEDDAALKKFAAAAYATLEANFNILPENFQITLPYMRDYDWLYNYKTKTGIQKSFAGLTRRARYLTESDIAFELFNKHYKSIKENYEVFYPSLKKFAAHQLQQLING
jgi:acyl carrier protein phosphodiesterase